MLIGEKIFIVEAGDSYIHPMGVVHQHQALEDSVRIETKIYPGGGAVASWNRLVGKSAWRCRVANVRFRRGQGPDRQLVSQKSCRGVR